MKLEAMLACPPALQAINAGMAGSIPFPYLLLDDHELAFSHSQQVVSPCLQAGKAGHSCTG